MQDFPFRIPFFFRSSAFFFFFFFFGRKGKSDNRRNRLDRGLKGNWLIHDFIFFFCFFLSTRFCRKILRFEYFFFTRTCSTRIFWYAFSNFGIQKVFWHLIEVSKYWNILKYGHGENAIRSRLLTFWLQCYRVVWKSSFDTI